MVAEIRPGNPQGADTKLTVIKPAKDSVLPFSADFIIPDKLLESQKRVFELVLQANAENRDILPEEISALFPKAISLRNARTSFSSAISRGNPIVRKEEGWEARSVGSIQAHGKNIKGKDGTWKPFKVEVPDANAARLIAENAKRTEEKNLRDLRIDITRQILQSIVDGKFKRLTKSPVEFAWKLMYGEDVKAPKMEPEEADEFRKLILESMKDTLIEIGDRKTNLDNISPEELDIFINMGIVLRSGNTLERLLDSISEHFSPDPTHIDKP